MYYSRISYVKIMFSLIVAYDTIVFILEEETCYTIGYNWGFQPVYVIDFKQERIKRTTKKYCFPTKDIILVNIDTL